MPERLIVDRVQKGLRKVLPSNIPTDITDRYGRELALLLRDQLTKVQEGKDSTVIQVPASWIDALMVELGGRRGRLLRKLMRREPRMRQLTVSVDWSRWQNPELGSVELHDVSVEDGLSE